MTQPVTTDRPERKAGAALADQLANYLAVRQHTLSTAHLSGFELLQAQADYALGEARELRDAVADLSHAAGRGEVLDGLWQHVEHEIADVVLSATVLAGMLPGAVTVEACIAEKTEADRGRG